MDTALSRLVLIVDDNLDSREMYACYLTAAGYRVEQAGHGFQGLEKAFRFSPDVIVMDLLMPTLDGWETIRWLKNRTQTKRIPIIALTGDSELEDLKLAKNAGCDALLLKPCPPETLLKEIVKLTQTAPQSSPR
jgi:two-component system, cell cycle response regulator DivK